MIKLIFEFGNEIIVVAVNGTYVRFGEVMADISKLKLDYAGVCREFPDLETNDNWRIETIARFKEKINELKTEEKIADYIISDLQKFGYKLKKINKDGWRNKKV